MTVRVKLAETPTEIRDVARVRHQVYVEEDGYLPPRGGIVCDIYDALPTTANLIGVVDGEVVGGVRATLHSEAGMPSDEAYDFWKQLPPDARPASCGMLRLRRANRAHARLLVSLYRMTIYWASVRGVTHLCALINPKIAPKIARMGFELVDEPFVDAKGQPTLPTRLDMRHLAADFRQFNARQDVGLWMDSFERALFERGQVIVQEGSPGDEAYLLMTGAVKALETGSGPDGPVVATFGPGTVFGELALLTERPRASTVVATEPTDVMVLRRDQFQRQLRDEPALAIHLLRSIGDRFHRAITVAPAATR